MSETQSVQSSSLVHNRPHLLTELPWLPLSPFLRRSRPHGPNGEWAEHDFLWRGVQPDGALLGTVPSAGSASVGFQRAAREHYGSVAAALQCRRGAKRPVLLSGLQQPHRHKQQYHGAHRDSKWVCKSGSISVRMLPPVSYFGLSPQRLRQGLNNRRSMWCSCRCCCWLSCSLYCQKNCRITSLWHWLTSILYFSVWIQVCAV